MVRKKSKIIHTTSNKRSSVFISVTGDTTTGVGVSFYLSYTGFSITYTSSSTVSILLTGILIINLRILQSKKLDVECSRIEHGKPRVNLYKLGTLIVKMSS